MALTRGYCVECIKYQKILYSPLKKEGAVPEDGSEVFVRNIPVKETEYDLVRFFEKIGDIFQLRLMMNENGKENRGFAYVTYFNSKFAKQAVATLNDLPYKEKYFLRIEQSLNNCRLFIGGIPTHKTKDQTWQELYKNGVKNIMDVIMYRSYTDRAENRGFVFVEFKTHEEAAYFRAKYGRTLRLWDNAVIVDWSVPVPQVDPSIMENVKILFVRNLDVSEAPEAFQNTLLRFVPKRHLEKVFKFKNYAFVHLQTREIAEKLMITLKEYYKDTPVEVMWSKPPNKFTTQEYRQKRVSSLSVRASPTKSSQAAKKALFETSSTTNQQFNGSHSSLDSMEEIERNWPQLPTWVNGLNGQAIFNSCQPATHLYESTAAAAHTFSQAPYDSSSDLLCFLTEALKFEAQQCTSPSGTDVPVVVSPTESPFLHLYPVYEKPQSPKYQQRCYCRYDAPRSSSPLEPVTPVATPSHSSLSESTLPEGVDPIKDYQRDMQRVYDPRREIFDIENMRREMALVPRGTTFQDIRNFVGDILDDYIDEGNPDRL